jgi:hypothetical protein
MCAADDRTGPDLYARTDARTGQQLLPIPRSQPSPTSIVPQRSGAAVTGEPGGGSA